jgi:hypothetical protein
MTGKITTTTRILNDALPTRDREHNQSERTYRYPTAAHTRRRLQTESPPAEMGGDLSGWISPIEELVQRLPLQLLFLVFPLAAICTARPNIPSSKLHFTSA